MADSTLSARSSSHSLIRAAIYARVSTTNHGQDPVMQTRELREYFERRGWQVAGEYVDLGISGAKEKRTELDRLMADAHRRRFDAIRECRRNPEYSEILSTGGERAWPTVFMKI